MGSRFLARRRRGRRLATASSAEPAAGKESSRYNECVDPLITRGSDMSVNPCRSSSLYRGRCVRVVVCVGATMVACRAAPSWGAQQRWLRKPRRGAQRFSRVPREHRGPGTALRRTRYRRRRVAGAINSRAASRGELERTLSRGSPADAGRRRRAREERRRDASFPGRFRRTDPSVLQDAKQHFGHALRGCSPRTRSGAFLAAEGRRSCLRSATPRFAAKATCC